MKSALGVLFKTFCVYIRSTLYTDRFGPHVLLRCYTEGFCKKVLECYEGRQTLQPPLRQKIPVNPKTSDRRLFSELPLGDPWMDSGLPMIWAYIYKNKHLKVPDSWDQCIQEFNQELSAKVLWLHTYM